MGDGGGWAITEGQSCIFCLARPCLPSLSLGSWSGKVTTVLPRSVPAWSPAKEHGCACRHHACSGEAGWRAPKAYLQSGACTLVIPTGQGAGESSQTPEPPAWVCRCRPEWKPQLPCLCGLGNPAWVALSPPALQGGRSPWGQQRCSAPFPAHSRSRRGASEGRFNCKRCRHRSVRPYDRLVILHLALSSNSSSRVSSIHKAFGLSQHALTTSQRHRQERITN